MVWRSDLLSLLSIAEHISRICLNNENYQRKAESHMNTGRITQLTSLPEPDWMATGSNPPIMLDEAEQKKAERELFKRLSDKNIAKFDFETSSFLLSLKTILYNASPEDFQLLKHAAQAIADKYGL